MDYKTSYTNVQSGKILAALCYFSIFFAPLILPIIVWILSDKPTSSHAAKSLIYHIITYLCPFILIFSVTLGTGALSSQSTWQAVVMITIAIILLVVTVWYTIKNIYRGVKVLISDESYFRP
jgi:arginine exporter protein ArgO